MTRMLVLDREFSREVIRDRKKQGIDRYDEVWDGVYVMPTSPSPAHQEMVGDFLSVLREVVVQENKGKVYPGLNVSDRPKNWKRNYRIPDALAVLNDSEAILFENHLFGGPDFLVEIRSPQEDPHEKIPFYAKVRAREMLIVDLKTREPRLLRHEGNGLVPVEPVTIDGEKWLQSEVLPLAFRRAGTKSTPRLEIIRTDGVKGLI